MEIRLGRVGTKKRGKILNNFTFADDAVLLGKKTKEVTKMGVELKNEGTKVGLSINSSNKKIMINEE